MSTNEKTELLTTDQSQYQCIDISSKFLHSLQEPDITEKVGIFYILYKLLIGIDPWESDLDRGTAIGQGKD